MTCWRCDRACARPEGWDVAIRPGEKKLSAATSVNVTRLAKESNLFNDRYARWSGVVFEFLQLGDGIHFNIMPVGESGLFGVSNARDAQKKAIRHSKQTAVTLGGDLMNISSDFG